MQPPKSCDLYPPLPILQSGRALAAATAGVPMQQLELHLTLFLPSLVVIMDEASAHVLPTAQELIVHIGATWHALVGFLAAAVIAQFFYTALPYPLLMAVVWGGLLCGALAAANTVAMWGFATQRVASVLLARYEGDSLLRSPEGKAGRGKGSSSSGPSPSPSPSPGHAPTFTPGVSGGSAGLMQQPKGAKRAGWVPRTHLLLLPRLRKALAQLFFRRWRFRPGDLQSVLAAAAAQGRGLVRWNPRQARRAALRALLSAGSVLVALNVFMFFHNMQYNWDDLVDLGNGQVPWDTDFGTGEERH
jgi:hypothetical protein